MARVNNTQATKLYASVPLKPVVVLNTLFWILSPFLKYVKKEKTTASTR